jgi:hypothetical protein
MLPHEMSGACSAHGDMRIGFIWLRGPVAGSCEHGNEPLCSVKCREFLD